MKALMRRATGVLVTTALVVVLVYGAVQAFSSSEPGRTLAESDDYSGQVCPATGCYATTCHATQGGGSGRHARAGYSGDSFSDELQ